MSKASVIARVLTGDRLECRVGSAKGESLVLSGTTRDIEPSVEGSTVLAANKALVTNAWAFAKFSYDKVHLATEAEQRWAEKRAGAHRDIARWLAGLADSLSTAAATGWCSVCCAQAEHRKVDRPTGHLPAYVCMECGSSTLPCAAPSCTNHAVRSRGPVRVPRFCAEHRHDIPGFAKASEKVDSLGDATAFLEYERANLKRSTMLLGAGATVLAGGAGAAWFGAEAIGGAIGTLAGGYSGAAATSYGLALLGFGSIASGGLGMAGGTLVVTALGGALGGVLGASVANAYVREDKSFRIEQLQTGVGVPVVVCNGFLTENETGWGEWERIVGQRYPDSPVYRVHWGSKELKHLGVLASRRLIQSAGGEAIRRAAGRATRVAKKKLGPIGPALLAADVAKNPWHVAKNRADKTGVVVADLLARTRAGSYVLIGHSLGARAMVVAAQTLASKQDGPRVEAVHLLGAAIGANGDWHSLTARVDDGVYNYHSANDLVLKYLYKVGQAGQSAAGHKGFSSATRLLHNVDVTEWVHGHAEYLANVTLR